MGLDLQYLLVRSSEREEVITALNRALQAYDLILEETPEISADWEPDPNDRVYCFAPHKGWQRFIVPYLQDLEAEEYYAIFQHVSADLESYVMYVQLYDSDLWGYILWLDGRMLDMFTSDPFYFEEEPPGEEVLPEEYEGDASVLSRVFEVPAEQITPYLQPVFGWTDLDREVYANEGDEHPLNDAHVVFDLMRQLGVPIPHFFGESPEKPLSEYLLV